MQFSEADVAHSCESKIIGNACGGYYDPGALGLDNVTKIFMMICIEYWWTNMDYLMANAHILES